MSSSNPPSGSALRSAALLPGEALLRCNGQDVTRKGSKNKRIMVILPAQLSLLKGIEAELAYLDNSLEDCPELVVETSEGATRFKGKFVMLENHIFAIECLPKQAQSVCTDVFDRALVFEEGEQTGGGGRAELQQQQGDWLFHFGCSSKADPISSTRVKGARKGQQQRPSSSLDKVPASSSGEEEESDDEFEGEDSSDEEYEGGNDAVTADVSLSQRSSGRARVKSTYRESSSDEEEEFEDEEEYDDSDFGGKTPKVKGGPKQQQQERKTKATPKDKPKEKQKPKKKPSTDAPKSQNKSKCQSQSRKRARGSSDDDDSDVVILDEAPTSQRSSSGRAKKKISYRESDDENEDEEAESSEEVEEDDESDFSE